MCFSATYGPPIFRAAMGERRFLTLLANISFDDPAERAQRRPGDKFSPMRDVFSSFDDNLRRHVTPSECLTLGESLIKFRGRCPFRVYMPQKPGRYGILVRTVADAQNRYLWKAWVYAGAPAQPEAAPPDTVFSKVDDLVNFMVKDVVRSGRNVTMDR
ncbi:PiggyBac transposable element-derived protein 4 [Amphibalanus amphitrite]|uniref:PiggyBac transposable element-derived protein 4 n=1 Tax=Amphibalanus amphitrite TaxID=1232801 RepID=A0A6A4VKH0_AMPAM|nr:PiggyBac transposable element-derived protein 4 [Amphibalanus amphitrite]